MLAAWTWKRIRWSLRKAMLPVRPSDLVLDVGSGSSPHPCADVLLERYVDVKHRYDPLVADRPTVLADACKMPFRDKVFDYVIAFHILEHVNNPASFLEEMVRVSKAGYIETPNAIFERINPYDVHLLEIMNIGESLIIYKKKSARPDKLFNEIELLKQSQSWNRFFYANPELFHVRYFWNETIKFKVINPEVSSDWFVDPELVEAHDNVIKIKGQSSGIRSKGLSVLRWWYRLRKKRKFNLSEILVCPNCHGSLANDQDWLNCSTCQVRYLNRPLPDFNHPMPL